MRGWQGRSGLVAVVYSRVYGGTQLKRLRRRFVRRSIGQRVAINPGDMTDSGLRFTAKQLGRDAGSGADQSDLPAVDGQRPTLLLVFLLL